MIPSHISPRFRFFLAGMVVAMFFGARQARADHIDEKLTENAKDLVKELQDKGFKNVGVLKFLVKKGKAPTDGNVGAMNMNMAERLENALLLGNNEYKPLGIIANATQYAAKADAKFSVKSVESRKAIFTHKYPLAWGKEQVFADAFITGTVDLSVDMKTATIDVGYFDRTGVIHRLSKFDVKTDRDILSDSGQSFAIARRGLKKRSLDDLDNDAANSAAQADSGKPVNQQLSKDSESAPIKVEILYNGVSQNISADDASAGEMKLGTPAKGDTVAIQLTNTTSQKIGVVLKVNGISTLDNETGEDASNRKWVLEPGKPYQIQGFYVADKVNIFQVLDDNESAARMADEAWAGKARAGYIDVSVFSEGPAPNPDSDTMKVGRGISLRNPTAKSRSLNHPATAAEAKKKARELTMKKRGLIDKGTNQQDSVLERDSLSNPTQIYQMHIGYYKPNTTSP